ncbi:MAG: LuxR C-terminal-related transcriptional regulator [Gaiellales bacterium]
MEREVVGRRDELGAVRALLGLANRFRALVLEGEPGIGKTTVWRAGVDDARDRGMAVLVARPTATESRLAYSALGDLLRDVPPDAFAALPEALGEALRAAALLDHATAFPDERLVSRALADLLRELACVGSMLVAIDDVQWLDERSRSALGFALRRLVDTSARVLLARRPPLGTSTELEDALPQADLDLVAIGPLTLAALHEILLARTGRAVPRPELVRISRASGGNPYYALEIARELARHGEARATIRLPKDVTRLTANRVLRLPAETRAVLLDLALRSRPVVPADPSALAPAVADGIVEIELDGTARFTHPLVAAAVVDSAEDHERRAAHHEIAMAATDEVERFRHRALAAEAVDDVAARAAEDGYRLASELGDAAAALELAELALRLSPHDDFAARLNRAIEYAECLDAAGATPDGRAVLEREIAAAPAGADVGRALARLGWVCWREADFPSGIAACSRALAGTDDLALMAECYETLTWLFENDLSKAYENALRLVDVRTEQGDEIAIARARLLSAYFGIVSGHPPDRAAIEHDIDLLRRQNILDGNPVPEMWMKFTDRLVESREILAQRREFSREAHDEQFTVACLFALGEVDTWLGDFDHARAAFDEALRLSDDLAGATYLGSLHACAGQLAAIEGRVADAEHHAAEALRTEHPQTSKGIVVALARAAEGAAALAAGDWELAATAYAAATVTLDGIGMSEPARFRYQGDHLEALVALGRYDEAGDLLNRLAMRLRVFERPWLAVQVERGRAVVAGATGDLDAALAAAEQALVQCDELPMPFERARTQLVLGRLRRRAKQRGAARIVLESALETFELLPAPLWATAARDELARLGLGRSGDDLTESEQAVAAAAARGLKNREIAEQLFMSPKTVEAHLSRAYRKLGVHSRAELVAKLASA